MSAVNLASSAALRNAFGTSGSGSSLSGPKEYGTLLLALAIPVSYLQPPLRLCGGTGKKSDGSGLGEGLKLFRLSAGDLEWDCRSRGRWFGVEGSEVDCRDLSGGRTGLVADVTAGLAPDILASLEIQFLGEFSPCICT